MSNRLLREAVSQLTERVKELEAQVASLPSGNVVWVTMDEFTLIERAKEGERIKNEECVKLEAQIADMRTQLSERDADNASMRHVIGRQAVELDRLRRELGRKR